MIWPSTAMEHPPMAHTERAALPDAWCRQNTLVRCSRAIRCDHCPSCEADEEHHRPVEELVDTAALNVLLCCCKELRSIPRKKVAIAQVEDLRGIVIPKGHCTCYDAAPLPCTQKWTTNKEDNKTAILLQKVNVRLCSF